MEAEESKKEMGVIGVKFSVYDSSSVAGKEMGQKRK